MVPINLFTDSNGETDTKKTDPETQEEEGERRKGQDVWRK